jgi:hypothetical protein
MRLVASCFIFLFMAPALALAAGNAVPDSVRKFDEYGRIAWADEKARLDNFVIQLTKDPNYVGYILVFNAPTMCAGEAQARAIRAKRYIVEHRRVPWNQVIWKEEGYSEQVQTTLYIFPRYITISYHEFTFEASRTKVHLKKNCTERIAKIKRSKW